ncbi:MAG: DUF86 domain-containing protein [Bacteroidetes bacterium]|nr:DUF86 domain-containing protein [Bacteroidota bacterium]MDA1121704.1 DUF86 domain-containing protein [Bacteroidota bacterium]
MKDNIRKYLFDIKESIQSIFSYLGDSRNFKKYEENKQLRRAVEREFEIIGEAVNIILKISPDVPIDSARKIVDLRNWVIHAYDSVDNVIIWGIIIKDLPKLLEEVDKLLSAYKEGM